MSDSRVKPPWNCELVAMGFEKKVDRAKRAQSVRLGQSGAAGKRKRCRKGKSCGATCIHSQNLCIVDLPWVSAPISQMRNGVQNRATDSTKSLKGAPEFKPPAEPPSHGKVEDINKVLDSLANGKVTDVEGAVKADKVNWRSGLGEGAVFGGAGAFGAFMMVPPDNLARGIAEEFPKGVGIKYGTIKPSEVALLKEIGETGAGPKVIAARYEDKPRNSGRNGVIAMERIPGKTLRKLWDAQEISRDDLSAGYIQGMAKLHRAGIAHNDAHFSNAIIQPDGKLKFIDFGGSSKDYKDVFEEMRKTLGADKGPVYGFGALSGPVADKARSNLRKAYRAGLRELGIEPGMGDANTFRAAMNNPDIDRQAKERAVLAMASKAYEGI